MAFNETSTVWTGYNPDRIQVRYLQAIIPAEGCFDLLGKRYSLRRALNGAGFVRAKEHPYKHTKKGRVVLHFDKAPGVKPVLFQHQTPGHCLEIVLYDPNADAETDRLIEKFSKELRGVVLHEETIFRLPHDLSRQ